MLTDEREESLLLLRSFRSWARGVMSFGTASKALLRTVYTSKTTNKSEGYAWSGED